MFYSQKSYRACQVKKCNQAYAIALDKMLFQPRSIDSYLSEELLLNTHSIWTEVFQMSTHNICFHEGISLKHVGTH